MIIDKIHISDKEAYIKNKKIDLSKGDFVFKTERLRRGEQLNIYGIQYLLEGQDLSRLFQYSSGSLLLDNSRPLFQFGVVKEMFPKHYDDVFESRVYNIAGYKDFEEGIFTNCKVLEVEGIPTLVSMGNKECSWESKWYKTPRPIHVRNLVWELESSKLIPENSFSHKIELYLKVGDLSYARNPESVQPLIIDSTDLKLNSITVDLSNIREFKIKYSAIILKDSNFHERILPNYNVPIGRPLLRAINIIEKVESKYQINSLNELRNLSSDFEMITNLRGDILSITGVLDLSATLTHSFSPIDNNLFEHLFLDMITDEFSYAEMKILGDKLLFDAQ